MPLFHFFALAVLGFLFPAVQAQSSASLVAQTPECALPCVLTAFQDGNCTLTTVQALETCICTNITLQSELSTCVQLSCAFDDQVTAAALEAELCKAYPKESRSHSVMLAVTISLAITLPIIALRMWARLKFTNRLWMDDYMTIVATVCIVALAGIEIVSANMGFGMHYWNVDIDKGTTLLQLFYVVQMLYILIQVFAKVAILQLFARIFTAKWFQRAVKIFTIFLFGHGSIFLFLIIFQCIPVYSIWDRSVPRKCLNVTDIGWAGGVFSIVEDLVILVLPMPEAHRLPLNTRKKAALLFMFSIGSFACVTSMVRLRYLVMFSKTFDTTWDNVDIVVWSIIELFAAMICGSLPAIRPLLVHFAPRLLGSVARIPGRNTDNSATWPSKRRSNLRDDKFCPLPDLPPADVIPEVDLEGQRHTGDNEGVVDTSGQNVEPGRRMRI